MARSPGTYCTVPAHQDGEHDAGCVPPADPGNPELRLLRAIFGLCGICDNQDQHHHTDEEYAAAISGHPYEPGRNHRHDV